MFEGFSEKICNQIDLLKRAKMVSNLSFGRGLTFLKVAKRFYDS